MGSIIADAGPGARNAAVLLTGLNNNKRGHRLPTAYHHRRDLEKKARKGALDKKAKERAAYARAFSYS